MIKSIENDNIRVGSAPNLVNSMDWRATGFIGRFKLPLFSVFPKLITIDDLENDRDLICFVIRDSFYMYNNVGEKGLSLSLVEHINKTWSEFYEENTRK